MMCLRAELIHLESLDLWMHLTTKSISVLRVNLNHCRVLPGCGLHSASCGRPSDNDELEEMVFRYNVHHHRDIIFSSGQHHVGIRSQ